EMMGLELGIVAVELHRSLGPQKADAVAVKVTAVVEIGLPVTVVVVVELRLEGTVVVDEIGLPVTVVVDEIGLLVTVVVDEIGLPVTVVGNWHQIAGSFEAVKKVAVVEQDSMRLVLVAAGPVGIAVSAAA